MKASTSKAGRVERVTPQLVRAFAFMLQHPTRWIAAPELVAAVGTTKMTIYSRFAGLTAGRLLRSRHFDRFTHWQLAPAWRDIELGRELHRRAVDGGLIQVGERKARAVAGTRSGHGRALDSR